MTRPDLLNLRDVALCFGKVVALDGVSFEVGVQEIIAVIGPNGAGKSSLLNVLSRVYDPARGVVELRGQDLLRLPPRSIAGHGIARTFQNLALFGHLSVLENVLVGRHHLMKAGAVGGGLLLRAARCEEHAHRAAAREALEFVGIGAYADDSVHSLPYGTQKAVELARSLAMEPALMLLDEPVAGMSNLERSEVAALIKRLPTERGVSVILVEHDMDMVMGIADRVIVLDFGQVIAEGPPSQIQADERVIRAYLGQDVEVMT